MHCYLWPNIPHSSEGASLGHANLQKLKVLEPEKQQRMSFCNTVDLIESVGESEM